MGQDKNFKENYERLEEVVEIMSKENKDIDESIKLFKEGIEIYKKLEKELASAEEEIVKILETTGEEHEYDK